MKSRCTRLMAGVLALAGLSLAGWGEVNVSLTITGDLDEILAIVQHLKQMGFGVGEPERENPMKLEIHSVQALPETSSAAPAENSSATPAEEAAPPAEPAPAPVPEPTLALREPTATPPNPSPGAPVVITVKAVDKEGRIDTLAATLVNTSLMVDLKDNGINGDAAAGDGIWTGTLPTPPDGGGAYEIQITAYDANGAPLMALNHDQILANVSAKTGINIPR